MENFERETYSISESAKVLGIARNSVYEAAKRGELPIIRIGARILIPKKALQKWLEEGQLKA